MKRSFARHFTITTFVLLYFFVSLTSTWHLIDFFKLSNPDWLAITLGIAFEIGAAASLCSIAILEKTSKTLIWSLFIGLTLFQIQGNMWYAYSRLHDYQAWVELFGLNDSDPILQKRVLAIVSGAVLPLVALGFIKSLVDYIRPRPESVLETQIVEEKKTEPVEISDGISELEAEIHQQKEIPVEIDNKKAQPAPVSKSVGQSEDALVSRGAVNVKPKK